LICEDNALNQQVICEHLTRVGVKTVVAENGKEGVSIVHQRIDVAVNSPGNKTDQKKPFDIIFMDIHMPVMDGLEAAARLVQMGITTPIVALTANVMSHDLILYKDAGMLDTLGKPFTSQELWECLQRYLPVTDNVLINENNQKTDDDKLKKQLKKHFIKSHIETLSNIINALENDDIKLAHRIVHTLKGNAGQIAEPKLAEAAKTVEGMLKNESIKPDDDALTELKAELDPVLDKLKPLLLEEVEQKTTGDETFDADKARQLYEKLEPLLKDNSYDVMQYIDELATIPGTGELRAYIENLDFALALEELQKLKGV